VDCSGSITVQRYMCKYADISHNNVSNISCNIQT
jgi:hypothetical protein